MDAMSGLGGTKPGRPASGIEPTPARPPVTPESPGTPAPADRISIAGSLGVTSGAEIKTPPSPPAEPAAELPVGGTSVPLMDYDGFLITQAGFEPDDVELLDLPLNGPSNWEQGIVTLSGERLNATPRYLAQQ